MSDYDVGYKKPPVATRFRPGQSGNRGGRKKGSKNIATMVEEALAEKVVVNINGRRKRVSKLEAAFIQQSNKAAGGDQRAVKLMIELLVGAQARDEAKTSGEPVSSETVRATNAQILSSLRARLESQKGGI